MAKGLEMTDKNQLDTKVIESSNCAQRLATPNYVVFCSYSGSDTQALSAQEFTAQE